MADKILSEELERLQNLQQEGMSGSYKNKDIQLNTPEGAKGGSRDVTNSESRKKTRKRGRHSQVDSQGILTPPTTGQVRESVKVLSKDTMCSGDLIIIQQVISDIYAYENVFSRFFFFFSNILA